MSMLTSEVLMNLQYMNAFLFALVYQPDFEEDGNTISPAEYLTDKLRERAGQRINGVGLDENEGE